MSERRLTLAAVVAFVLGVALMIPFEHAATLTLGVLLLLAFIVLGVFALATPERLAQRPQDETPSEHRPTGGDTSHGKSGNNEAVVHAERD